MVPKGKIESCVRDKRMCEFFVINKGRTGEAWKFDA